MRSKGKNIWRRAPDAPDAAIPEPVRGRDPRENRQSVIGRDLCVVGTIRSDGNVRIEGRVEGDVTSRALTVGVSATLIGDVTAGIAEIHGTVEGDVTADTVVLGRTARLKGDITQRSLTIENGADFDGRVRHTGAKAGAAAPSRAGAATDAQTPAPPAAAKAKSATG